MTTTDAPVTVERPISEHPCHGWFAHAGDRLTHRQWTRHGELMPTCERCGTPIDHEHNETGPVSWVPEQRHRLAALASAPAEPAWHTDLGGLIEARRIAQAAYKDIERAKAQNTHIPGNPYDVALAALNPALGMLAVLVDQRASAPAGDGDVGLLEAARDLLDAHKRLGGAAEYRADLWDCLETNVERLARPRAAVGEREA